MDKKEILKFPNRVKFWEYIYKIDNGLDFGNTLKLGLHWFYYKGQRYNTYNFKGTLSELNRLMGTRFDVKNSVCHGSRYTIFIEPFNLELSETKEEVVDEVLVKMEFEEDKPEVDWGWVNSLNNTKEDKIKLDEYALSFNVELKRNMTLKNMIRHFKKELESA